MCQLGLGLGRTVLCRLKIIIGCVGLRLWIEFILLWDDVGKSCIASDIL
jgi:hypothetical protein